MKKSKKYYVVWKGKKPGIYATWEECKAMISGFDGAQYKAFPTQQEAKTAFDKTFAEYKGKTISKKPFSPEKLALIGKPTMHSISVDAASSGNPGIMEYQGVDTKTKKTLFKMGPFQQGTNNIGEFLALVHGLAFLKQHNSDRIIYSDSKIAIGWVKKKSCNTKLKRTPKNEALFELIARAEEWLKKTNYSTRIVKWETRAWGEIPADFGRK
ncbi:MAG TPA: ribonuclease H family protein [Flavobacteriaceae bacterium]|nr:ribonuclease H family protein [Flavobacteriaceae bacterium]